ncbi:hypothetical protein [Cohnella cholangitidis]|uniref:GNAT family N-acetyltransferase n=1 Tax=Cohnella cholangitidis TaxID=2598458 RepID=A0A7G5BS36_9BACL|nr:hypothetical protein [Cohnella cholangitidis]QMV39770.1 hypothetical protein FPL14_00025 [Cohnella cholangitidis]
MAIRFGRCTDDNDYARVALFMVERRRDLHPSLCTIDMVTMLYAYMTEGQLHYSEDENGRIVGAGAYYLGTPEEEFRDRSFALLDVTIVDKARRGTRLFLKGLQYMINHIADSHPEIETVRLCALSDNTYLCKLYAKFARFEGTKDGKVGQESVFSGQIHHIRYILNRLLPL